MLPLLMDDQMDAADRPVQKEPAATARRRRSRGLLQQHTEQCSFDLHSTQKQTEMTGVFGVSTRSSSRAFIRCAARPETPRTHRERRPCAGACDMSPPATQPPARRASPPAAAPSWVTLGSRRTRRPATPRGRAGPSRRTQQRVCTFYRVHGSARRGAASPRAAAG